MRITIITVKGECPAAAIITAMKQIKWKWEKWRSGVKRAKGPVCCQRLHNSGSQHFQKALQVANEATDVFCRSSMGLSAGKHFRKQKRNVSKFLSRDSTLGSKRRGSINIFFLKKCMNKIRALENVVSVLVLPLPSCF